jgi:hypothetical protein
MIWDVFPTLLKLDSLTPNIECIKRRWSGSQSAACCLSGRAAALVIPFKDKQDRLTGSVEFSLAASRHAAVSADRTSDSSMQTHRRQ